MSLHPISVAGFRPIAQIKLSHHLKFLKDQNALSNSLQLLASPHSGAPVVDTEGRFVGFISEFDLLAALESGRELEQLQAYEIMVQDPKAAHLNDDCRCRPNDERTPNSSAAAGRGWRGSRIDYPPCSLEHVNSIRLGSGRQVDEYS